MASEPNADNKHCHPPPPSTARLQASLQEAPFNLKDFVERVEDEERTFFYLGYGSNLSNETFRGKRGIKPISQINVQVPSLRVTFDLPGVPYLEPCFANSGLRDTEDADRNGLANSRSINDEKSPLLVTAAKGSGYRKDRWQKGLVGVVYEVTAKDFAHIIATEGGGASYQDIVVDCYPFDTSDPAEPVPWHPTQAPFKAHTLFAPSFPPEDPRGRIRRPDPSYAQPSARYLKLMIDGAAELGLPYEYQQHLQSLRHFRITTFKQRIGMAALLAVWLPVLLLVFGLGKVFADKKGRFPEWLMRLMSGVFKAVWLSYDTIFKRMFGDGERTLTDGVNDGQRALQLESQPLTGNENATGTAVEVENHVTQLV